MKRKLLLCMLAISLLVAMAIPSLALADDELYFITDQAQLLSETQWQTLEQQATNISNTYVCGVYVVIVEDYRDYGTSMKNANDQIYNAYSLGSGEEHDGVLLLLSMDDRDYYLRSYGQWGNYAFSNEGFDQLEDVFLDDFEYNNWYDGLVDYLSESEAFLASAMQGEPRGEEGKILFDLLMIVGIPCLAALAVCMVLKGQMKSVRKQANATDYMKLDENVLRIREDRFTHTTETRRRIESSSSSGSGDSGRGGKF